MNQPGVPPSTRTRWRDPVPETDHVSRRCRRCSRWLPPEQGLSWCWECAAQNILTALLICGMSLLILWFM